MLAVLRSPQVFGQVNGVPGLRTALGQWTLSLSKRDGALRQAQGTLTQTDAVEAQARTLVEALAAAWSADAVPTIVERILGTQNEAAAAALRFACQEVVPRLARTGDESPRSCTLWTAGMFRPGRPAHRCAD